METKKIFESKSSIFKRFIFESESDRIESEYLWNKCWQDRYIISTRKIPIIGKRGGSNVCQWKIYQISIEWNLPFSPRSPFERIFESEEIITEISVCPIYKDKCQFSGNSVSVNSWWQSPRRFPGTKFNVIQTSCRILAKNSKILLILSHCN